MNKPVIRKEIVVVLDDNERFLDICRRWLKSAGFADVRCLSNPDTAPNEIVSIDPDLVLVDIHLGSDYDGLKILRALRAANFRGLAVVVSGDSSKEQCFRAAKAGANDFILKRPNVKIGDEVCRVLDQAQKSNEPLRAVPLSELGYLRSFGLTPREIEILQEFAKDYGAQKTVADRLDKAPAQLRKAFARIYKKLDIDNLGQLIHVITVCSMFNPGD